MIIRRIALIAAAGGAAAAVAIALAAGSSSAARSTAGNLSESQILMIAESAATAAGDPNPTLIQHAEGTRAQANLVASGETVPGNQDSFLIVEIGHFVASGAPVPPGAPAPTGSVMTLVVDASTGQQTDFGIQDNVPDLSQLGPVTTDYAAPASANADRVRKGIVTGAIVYGGGPPRPEKSRAKLGGVVSVFTMTGKLVTRHDVRRGRPFRFVLSPGRYQLNAGRSLHPNGGCPPKTALVRAGKITRMNVETGCSVP